MHKLQRFTGSNFKKYAKNKDLKVSYLCSRKLLFTTKSAVCDIVTIFLKRKMKLKF